MSVEENTRWKRIYGTRVPELRDTIAFGKEPPEKRKQILKDFNSKFQEEFAKTKEIHRFVSTTPAVKETVETCKIKSPYAQQYGNGNYVSMTVSPFLRYGAIRMTFDKKCLLQKNKLTPLKYVESREECEKSGGKWGEDCIGIQLMHEEEVRVRPKKEDSVVDCGCLKEVTVLLKKPREDNAFRKEVLEQDNEANKQRFKLLQKIVKKCPVTVDTLTEIYE